MIGELLASRRARLVTLDRAGRHRQDARSRCRPSAELADDYPRRRVRGPRSRRARPGARARRRRAGARRRRDALARADRRPAAAARPRQLRARRRRPPATVSRVLARVPQPRVLVTSRELLQIAAEHEYPRPVAGRAPSGRALPSSVPARSSRRSRSTRSCGRDLRAARPAPARDRARGRAPQGARRRRTSRPARPAAASLLSGGPRRPTRAPARRCTPRSRGATSCSTPRSSALFAGSPSSPAG